MSKRKATKQTAVKVNPHIRSDNLVIEAACLYSANLAAEAGALRAMPDRVKSFEATEKISDRFYKKAEAALKVLAATHAYGRDAIEAKARVISPLALGAANLSMSTLETAAVVTFADDVTRFVKTLREIDRTTTPE